jgi:hypothetical protein
MVFDLGPIPSTYWRRHFRRVAICHWPCRSRAWIYCSRRVPHSAPVKAQWVAGNITIQDAFFQIFLTSDRHLSSPGDSEFRHYSHGFSIDRSGSLEPSRPGGRTAPVPAIHLPRAFADAPSVSVDPSGGGIGVDGPPGTEPLSVRRGSS